MQYFLYVAPLKWADLHPEAAVSTYTDPEPRRYTKYTIFVRAGSHNPHRRPAPGASLRRYPIRLFTLCAVRMVYVFFSAHAQTRGAGGCLRLLALAKNQDKPDLEAV